MTSFVALVCVGLAALLSVVPGAEPIKPSPTTDRDPIPMIYRIPCGSTSAGWLKDPCDGRSQYCDTTAVAKCGSCSRICQLTQSTTECQRSCKMYLAYQQETAKNQAFNNKIDSMDKAGKTERRMLEEKVENLVKWNIGLTLGVLVIGVVLMVCLVLIVYVSVSIKDHNRTKYGPVSQESDTDKKDAESGLGTAGNTTDNSPESLRRIHADAHVVDGAEVRPADGDEVLNEDDNAPPARNALPPWNVVDQTEKDVSVDKPTVHRYINSTYEDVYAGVTRNVAALFRNDAPKFPTVLS